MNISMNSLAQQFAKRLWWLTLLRGTALALVGVLALVWPGAATSVLVTLIGAYLVLEAVFSFGRAVAARRKGAELAVPDGVVGGPGAEGDPRTGFGGSAFGGSGFGAGATGGAAFGAGGFGPAGFASPWSRPAPSARSHVMRGVFLTILGVVFLLLPGLVGTVAVLVFLYMLAFGLVLAGAVTLTMSRAAARAGAPATAGTVLGVVMLVASGALLLSILLAPVATAMVVVQMVSILLVIAGVALVALAFSVRKAANAPASITTI